jgi:heme-degrading monooxygenase HmoA
MKTSARWASICATAFVRSGAARPFSTESLQGSTWSSQERPAERRRNREDGVSAMVVVVFRAHRTAAGLGPDYSEELRRMAALAVKMPGYISHKAFAAEDGERLSLFEWESAETLHAWATHPEAGASSTRTIGCRSARSCASRHSGAKIRVTGVIGLTTWQLDSIFY